MSAFAGHGGSASSTLPSGQGFTPKQYQQLKEKSPENVSIDKPRAYLNYVMFDEHFNMIDEQSGIRQVKEEPDQLQMLASGKMIMKKGGLLYVYTSNESKQDVYFDEMIVMDAPGPVLEEMHYYPFGLTMDGISHKAIGSPDNNTLFSGKDLQHQEFSNGQGLEWYDYGARMMDPQIGRWHVSDPVAEKYNSVSPYAFVDNNPLLKIDKDGRDWVITSTVKDGTTHYNIVFQAAIMNSSAANINMKSLIANQVKTFAEIYGIENVTATMNLRQINSMGDLKSNEHLIEILDAERFRDVKDGHVGGDAVLGGKFIRINSIVIDEKTGKLNSKGTISHEIGHTGGLLHPFEFAEKRFFPNGKPVSADKQEYYNSANDISVEANVMNYLQYAIKSFPWVSKSQLKDYFRENAAALPGQLQQIIQNFYEGNLNNNADLNARKFMEKINNYSGITK